MQDNNSNNIKRGMSSIDNKAHKMMELSPKHQGRNNRYGLQAGTTIQEQIAIKREKITSKSPQNNYNKQILNTSRANNKY